MLDISHITNRPRGALVKHKHGLGLGKESSARENGEWVNSFHPVREPFALDLGRVQSGWETYETGKGRVVIVAPAGTPQPAKPSDKARGIVVAPVASDELGNNAELVIDTQPAATGFAALFNEATAHPNAAEGQIPIVFYNGDNFDGEPEFNIVDWVDRPPLFGLRLVALPQIAQPEASEAPPAVSIGAEN